MSDFLLRINEIGVIDNTYFFNCDSKKDIPISVYLFLDSSAGELVRDCLLNNKKVTTFSTVINEESFNVILYPVGSQFLFYGTNLKLTKNMISNLLNLLSVLAFHYSNPTTSNKGDNQFIYNSIQKLNNELLNKSREAEKLNNRLNHLNSILSDRLVQDPLTNLVSRYQYRDEIDRLLKQFPKGYGLFWFMDIDDFKSVNDNYGHNVGDKYLVEFANRLKTLPIPNLVKMRIAGDEFGLFFANITDISEKSITGLVEVFKEHVLYPIDIDGKKHDLKISIGIAIYKYHSNDIHLLIDYADFAMYQAKKSKNQIFKLFNIKDFNEQVIV